MDFVPLAYMNTELPLERLRNRIFKQLATLGHNASEFAAGRLFHQGLSLAGKTAEILEQPSRGVDSI